jgi:hypothetical protein
MGTCDQEGSTRHEDRNLNKLNQLKDQNGVPKRLWPIWPSNTVVATRPNKERRDTPEFPFPRLARAICDEHDQNGGGETLKGSGKVPVPTDRGNSLSDGSRRW